VQYLIEDVNAKGPSVISNGSGFVAIQPGKSPQLDIPIDVKGAAT
jgi:hypothetical protein